MIAAYDGNTNAINNAIAACGANQYVQLGAGTFNLTSGGSTSNGIKMKGNVVLRGMGANQTFLVFASGAYDGCSGGYGTAVCFQGSGAYWVSDSGVSWTAGYAQGTTQITLANTTGIIAGSTAIGLDQCSDGYSGMPCSSGPEVDNGNYFNCNRAWVAGTPNTGCAINGPDASNQRPSRPQNELFLVTAVNSATGGVTLNGSIRSPDWNSARTPNAWVIPLIQNAGVENLSIDTSASASRGIVSYYAANIWVRGVRVVKPYYAGIFFVVTAHAQAESNYIYGTSGAPGADIFGLNSTASSDCLFQNNIVQDEQVSTGNEGADTGSVYSYNLFINNYNGNDGIYPAIFPHAGDRYQLYEGNVANSYYGENYHGPKMMNTLFRNFLTGWESCANGQCGTHTAKASATTPVRMVEGSRYHNIIGNVLGMPTVSIAYKTSSGFASGAIYEIGSGNGSIPHDPIVGTSSSFWGNYDIYTGATRWCGNSADSGWSTTCASMSEVPTSFTPYGNAAPTKGDTGAGQAAMPASFYLSSKPSWWGSMPWPAIGPDVTSGNVGQCSGTLNVSGRFNGLPATSASQCAGSGLTASAWGGHVNAIPAMICFLNVMGGVPDGTNGVLRFNASSCYPGSTVGSAGPAPPTNLTAIIQ